MTAQIKMDRNMVIDNERFTEARSKEGGLAIKRAEKVPAAKAGTLTARTDADTGSVTLGAGHGITDGMIVDVYWTGGQRRGMTVGTVATNVVPLDGGAGDDLPVTSTAVQVMERQEFTFGVAGSDLVALGFKAVGRATIVLAGADDVEDYAVVFEGSAGNAETWLEDDLSVNPIDGDVITKVFMSHNDTSGVKEITVMAVTA